MGFLLIFSVCQSRDERHTDINITLLDNDHGAVDLVSDVINELSDHQQTRRLKNEMLKRVNDPHRHLRLERVRAHLISGDNILVK